jgi:hypothetical protein
VRGSRSAVPPGRHLEILTRVCSDEMLELLIYRPSRRSSSERREPSSWDAVPFLTRRTVDVELSPVFASDLGGGGVGDEAEIRSDVPPASALRIAPSPPARLVGRFPQLSTTSARRPICVLVSDLDPRSVLRPSGIVPPASQVSTAVRNVRRVGGCAVLLLELVGERHSALPFRSTAGPRAQPPAGGRPRSRPCIRPPPEHSVSMPGERRLSLQRRRVPEDLGNKRIEMPSSAQG